MFIVLDGIDGAGKGKQRLEILEYLKDKVKNLDTVDFPNHKSAVYEHLIHPALHEEIKMNPSSWLLAFVLDQMLVSERINKAIGSNTDYFVADGYFTTTIAYQCLMGGYFTLEQMKSLEQIIKIPKPDLAIFIDVDPDIAMKRKAKEEGHDEGMDIFERDLEKQRNLRKAFTKMVKDNIFCDKWFVVDGNKSIQQVTEQIINKLNIK